MTLFPQYDPVCFAGQIHCGTGRIAVFTGWYDSSLVAKQLKPDQYAAIGNLYSAATGIDPAIRNLLANPQVDVVACLSATGADTNANSPSLLLAAFLQEPSDPVLVADDTGVNYWGSINPDLGLVRVKDDIPIEYLRLLKSRVSPICFSGNLASARDLILYCQSLALIPRMEIAPSQSPIRIPPPEVKLSILPGPSHGVTVSGETIVETWLKIVHAIYTTGQVTPTGNGQPWQELINLVAVVHNEPEDLYFPSGNWFPCTREYLFGTESASGYVGQMVYDSQYEQGIKYTYGQRMRSWFGKDQVEEVVSKLVNERDAASGVISLWDSGSGLNARHDREADSSDHTYGKSPCLNHVWLRIKASGELVLTALFRSNDMYSAWPSNAMGLRCLQRHVFDRLREEGVQDITMGPLITTSLSAHLYRDCWPDAEKVVNLYNRTFAKPDFSDPVGSYTVHRDPDRAGVVVVRRLGVGTNARQCTFYEGTNPNRLLREIALDAPSIDPSHMGYLGMEITRAFLDPNFVQDAPWWKKPSLG